MSIRDRGLIKWNGFFMPEHVKALKNLHIEDQKIKMPLLDEYQLQEYEERIHYAMEYRLPVEFKLYDNGFEETVKGHVHYVDQINKRFNVKDNQSQVHYVRYDEIMDVKVID